MDKKVIFNKVNVFGEIENTYKKIIKNLSFDIKESEIISIVSENKYEKNIIKKTLVKDVNLSSGKIEFKGFSLKDDSLIKNMTGVISKTKFDNVSKTQTVIDFVIKNKNVEFLIGESYNSEIYNLEKSLNEVKKNIKIFSSKENYFQFQHQNRIEKYISFINENDSYILEQKKIHDQIQSLVNENKEYENIKDSLIKKHAIDIRDVHIFSKKLIKNKRKKIDDKIVYLSEMLRKEKEEIKKRVNKVHSKIHHNELVYNRLKKQTERFVKRYLSLNFEGVELNEDFKKLFSLFIDSNDKKDFFENFDILIEKMDVLINTLSEEHSRKLIEWKAFLLNIEGDASAINTSTYNKINDWILNDIKKDIDFYNRSVEDIDKKLKDVNSKDRKERIHLLRKNWELETISLRYQKQIFREKIDVITESKNYIIETSLLHSNNSLNEFYSSIGDYKKKILTIDIAFILWKEKQKIKSLKLDLKQRIKMNNDFIQKNNIKIPKLNKFLDKEATYLSINDSLVGSFIFDSYKKMKDKILNTNNDKFNEIYSEKIIELKIEKKTIIEKLKSTKDQKKTIRIELELKMLDLFDEVKLNVSCASNKFSSLTYEQKQKVFLIKSILSGKKLIIIDEPNFKEETYFKSILDIFKNKYGLTFLLLTNDIEEASLFSDVVVVVWLGLLCEINSGKNIISNPIHPYTKNILREVKEIRFKDREIKEVFNQLKFIKRSPYSVLELFELKEGHYIYATQEERKNWT